MLNINFDFYPILIGVGVFIAVLILSVYFKKIGFKNVVAIDYEIFFVIVAGIGVVFAMLFQNLYNFIESPSTYQWTWAMTFFGGLVGGFSAFVLGYYFYMRKKYPKSFTAVSVIAGPGIALAHGIGRIGCTLDGCCYGSAVDPNSPFAWMGMVFRTTDGVAVWPTQLMEAVFLLLLAGLLYDFAFKKNWRMNLPIYGISYSIFRFLIEFLRGDHRGTFIPGLSPSQFWSIILFLGSVVYLIVIVLSKKYTPLDFDLSSMMKEENKTNNSNN